MIKIDGNRCEFKYLVDTSLDEILKSISPKAFELSCITSDVDKILLAIDSKYGRGTALRMFSMIIADNYTLEEIDKADKEINEDE